MNAPINLPFFSLFLLCSSVAFGFVFVLSFFFLLSFVAFGLVLLDFFPLFNGFAKVGWH